MKNKKRLDQRVQELYPEYSRTQIQSWIMQGKVSIDNKVNTKPGTQVTDEDPVVLQVEIPKYVCRAGWKLEKALDYFNIDPAGLVILDAGLSTGGFTDCLLQRNVKHVYGIDVGYGQVHEKIRAHQQVTVKEKTNLRYLTLADLGEPVDLITLDLSFISLLKVIEPVYNLLKPHGKLITLIKPQFEAERHEVGKGGIIKDPLIHSKVVANVTKKIQEAGFNLIDVTDSPITGSYGNKEFLAYFIKNNN